MAILIRNARVLTMDDRDTELERADILVRGTKIEALEPDIRPSESEQDLRVIDAEGLLAMPGLVNGHFHSGSNLMRGVDLDVPLSVLMLYGYGSTESPDRHLHYIRVLWGAIEMLKNGITGVHDDPHYAPAPTEDSIDGTMQAYLDSGMRATATIAYPIVPEYEKYPYVKELLPDEIRQQMDKSAAAISPDYLLGLYDRYIERWHGAGDGRLRAAVSISTPERVTPEYFRALSQLSRKHGLAFDMHIGEQKYQRVLSLQKHGKSFFQYARDLGCLDEHVMIIHAIWADEHDIDAIADCGCSVVHNPISNLWIGSGVMPYRRIWDKGIPIGLGIDDMAVDGAANLWGVAKTAGLIHRISEPDWLKWPKASELLWSLTRGGARGMCLQDKLGMLAPDYQADLILLDLSTTAFTPLNDLRRQLIYSESGSSVVLTMVGGEVVVENGKVLTVDEESVKEEVRQLSARFRQDLARVAESGDRLLPYWRQMHLRVADDDVGLNRWAGPMVP